MGGSQGGVLQVVGLPCGDEATIGYDPPPTLIFPIHGRDILPLHERAQDVRKWPFVVNVRHGMSLHHLVQVLIPWAVCGDADAACGAQHLEQLIPHDGKENAPQVLTPVAAALSLWGGMG